MTRYERASIHGRFQPFHNGHLEYLTAALDRAEFLVVGITQPLSRRLVQVQNPDAIHRATPHSNPLTYYERSVMIDAVMAGLTVDRSRYSLTPFPIEEPEYLTDFVPTSIPILTTTYDRWNESKIDTLRSCGFQVDNLWSRDRKEVQGHVVRALIQAGDETWRNLVPAPVVRFVEDFAVTERLRSLRSHGG